ncbi:WXG100 family type VII secretion target [Streptomyces carminius]|uniref:WXG100 family type VII secretion target n=1 Tax=Streptomyces carminius TaxID=2665496 RepID=A0A2M8M4T2_9ACTN|nr:WXG100 family type VII secretion target [Streptomyces carminius]PJE99217.1 WXG100 family type VII secretion target [Streptomyces carminius]
MSGEGGSGGNFQSDDAQLQQLISEVQSMQSTLKTKIANLNAVVDTIEGAWKGEAHRSYDTLQRQANDFARALDGKLQMMEEALRASKDGFTANEIDQMESFNQIAKASPISDFTGVGVTPTAK